MAWKHDLPNGLACGFLNWERNNKSFFLDVIMILWKMLKVERCTTLWILLNCNISSVVTVACWDVMVCVGVGTLIFPVSTQPNLVLIAMGTGDPKYVHLTTSIYIVCLPVGLAIKALYPGSWGGGEREPGIHSLCMHLSFQHSRTHFLCL